MSSEKILLATDCSQACEEALIVATSLARDTGSRLIIAYVSESELHPVGELFNEEPKASPRDTARLQAVRPPDSSVDHEHRLLFGERPVDLIGDSTTGCMSAHAASFYILCKHRLNQQTPCPAV